MTVFPIKPRLFLNAFNLATDELAQVYIQTGTVDRIDVQKAITLFEQAAKFAEPKQLALIQQTLLELHLYAEGKFTSTQLGHKLQDFFAAEHLAFS